MQTAKIQLGNFALETLEYASQGNAIRVRVKNTTHAGLMPGDEGELEGPHQDGWAVKFDCIRGLKKTDKSEATVFMRKDDIETIGEPEPEGNAS